MGKYIKSLTLSNSENIIVEAIFKRKRFWNSTIIISSIMSLVLLFSLLDMHDRINSNDIFRPTGNDFSIVGILFMYSFVWGCSELFNQLSQELALTNKRLIIKKGVFNKNTYNIPINMIQTIQVNAGTLSIFNINSSVEKVKNIKNIQQIKEAIQELLDAKQTLSQAELQELTLIGLSDLKFRKDSLFNKFCSLAFWLILVPLMGGFFGLFIQYLPFG